MRCFRKRTAIPVLGFLVTCLVIFNLVADHAFVPVRLLSSQGNFELLSTATSLLPSIPSRSL